jgi:hypothetical protein
MDGLSVARKTFSFVKPVLTPRKFRKLWRNRPAPMSSGSESATCRKISALRKLKNRSPEAIDGASLRNARETPDCESCKAGASPKSSPVTKDARSAKLRTRKSIGAWRFALKFAGRKPSSAVLAQ